MDSINNKDLHNAEINKPNETVFYEIKPERRESIKEAYQHIGTLISRIVDVKSTKAAESSENKMISINEKREINIIEFAFSGCPIDGHGGHWDGERGNSTWYPDKEEVPKNPNTNPEKRSWEEILDKYGIEGIPFEDGEPDFSEVSKGTVEIDDFSENRYGKGGNFDQATEKLAEERGCTKEEVKAWMKENKYTWHERSDCKTMDKVPTEVHGNVRHEGGISEIKKQGKEGE
jgi:hypothetical protein